MYVSVRANVRTAEASRAGLAQGLSVAFRSGAVTGMLVVGLGLLAVAGYYAILTAGFGLDINNPEQGRIIVDSLVGLGFGASLISIFARLGGGIFTKGADVGGDMVGKVEAGIPEDDPRNPATIADNVGDNVGDCAGMAADLFETFAVTTVATMVLASIYFSGAEKVSLMLYPLAIAGMSIITSIIGTFFVRLGSGGNIMGALYKGVIATVVLSLIGLWPLTQKLIGMDTVLTIGQGADAISFTGMTLFWCGLVGLAVTGALIWITEYYTGTNFAPGARHRQGVGDRPRHQCDPGPGGFDGIDGVAGPGDLRRHRRHLSAGGPVRHRHRGLHHAVAGRHDRGAGRLRSGHRQCRRHRRNGGSGRRCPQDHRRAGRGGQHHQGGDQGLCHRFGGPGRAGAVRRLYPGSEVSSPARAAVSSPGLTMPDFSLADPWVVVGLFFGGMLPYLFGGIAMTAVGRAAGAVVEEVRKQFREMPGIMQGTQKPNYARAVDLLTKAAIREMVVPSMLPVFSPIVLFVLVLWIAGKTQAFDAVGAMLMGVIVTGLFVAISMTSGGGAWDNAKKFIEDGNYGGKGSEAHKAAVTGDTVGDPYKDTAGPAVNPMIKITNIVALLLLATLAHF